MQFHSPPARPSAVHGRQRLGQQGQPLCGLSYAPIRLGQQGKIIRPLLLGPRGLVGCQALAHLRRPFCPLSLSSEGPTPHDCRLRQHFCKPLLVHKHHARLYPLVHGLWLPAGLMQRCRKAQGTCQTKGVRQGVG
jgi:hypothetical protein